ncbi:MAG TPA: MiaB/RimO family radical SAM methylthiotransferase, partial [Halanaerobiales bacterium]|nr:MiaB/RimO family radical SAM methylthiotransferase [Halanaerobiales bacterium]
MVNIGLITLGCPKNQVDSEIMMGLIDKKKDFRLVEDYGRADVIVINTCGFIEDAKEESINTILEAGRYKILGNCKGLIVTGCLAQRYKEVILNEIPEVDAVLGTGSFDKIIEVIENIFKKERLSIETFNYVGKPLFEYKANLPRVIADKHFAYVKIAEGCNNNCSYCTIPMIRGPLFSRPIEDIYKEVNRFAKQGVREIILIAQDTTRYGLDRYGKPALIKLLKELVKIRELKWLRLMYSYPEHLDQELIALIAREDKLCNYLDIPIQHSSNYIRELMNRKG